MDSLIESFSEGLTQPLGTLVYIGAGASFPMGSQHCAVAQRVVLVEGDPDLGAELRRSTTRLQGVEVCVTAVAPLPGDLSWRRYNVPALNGPVDAAVLASFYPRLRQSDDIRVQSRSLQDLIASLEITNQAQRGNALVLDVPGQESALIASLSEDLLTTFEWLVLRGCAMDLEPGGVPLEQTVMTLGERFYMPADCGLEQDPLWPVITLQLDAQRFRSARLVARIDVLESALAQCQREGEDLRRVNDAQRQANASLAAQAQALAGERDGLRASNVELLRGADDLRRQLAALEACKLAADENAAKQATKVSELGGARVADAKLATDLQNKIKSLGDAKDRYAQLSGELQKSLSAEQARVCELEVERDTLHQRQEQLYEELVKAETQIEFIKDLLLQDAQS